MARNTKLWSLLILVFALVVACAPSEEPNQDVATAPPPQEQEPAAEEPLPEWVYFEVGFPTPEQGRFVIALADPAMIEQARKAIENPDENPSSVMGIIVKTPAPYNPPWSYHIDPTTIELFENAIEVCDAAPDYVEEHLDEVCGAFLPDCRWCPWFSKVVRELPAPSSGDEEPAE